MLNDIIVVVKCTNTYIHFVIVSAQNHTIRNAVLSVYAELVLRLLTAKELKRELTPAEKDRRRALLDRLTVVVGILDLLTNHN